LLDIPQEPVTFEKTLVGKIETARCPSRGCYLIWQQLAKIEADENTLRRKEKFEK
jgi:hypothetical protein